MAGEASSRTQRHSREEKLRAKRERDWWTSEQNGREMHAEDREEIEIGGSDEWRNDQLKTLPLPPQISPQYSSLVKSIHSLSPQITTVHSSTTPKNGIRSLPLLNRRAKLWLFQSLGSSSTSLQGLSPLEATARMIFYGELRHFNNGQAVEY
ncbi:hypothetical protein TorRG33x02_132840 [Trema orientale]|uniref:Uncharacterized protein n=1 Tax=Trema orientale TaxID=63057 RepID=A0A2P5EZB4_TREOI|nr:hypothetical protein TorRG33x02_132840 [Trema orientale]